MSDAANTKLKRSLKSRHMNMIALGGSIGTGLFVAGGEVVSTARNKEACPYGTRAALW